MGRHLVRSILTACLAVTAALGLLALLVPDGSGAATYATASAAIALTAATAGLLAGLLATGLSGAIVAYVHLPPLDSVHVDRPDEIAGLVIFLVSGLVVATAASHVRRRSMAAVPPSHSSGVRPWTNATPRRPPSLVEPLSSRELEVLSFLAAGCSNEDIAGSLLVSINTVKTHLKNVYGKLGVTSRTQAILRALELELISAPSLRADDRDEREAA